jgi:hypothetical protein
MNYLCYLFKSMFFHHCPLGVQAFFVHSAAVRHPAITIHQAELPQTAVSSEG